MIPAGDSVALDAYLEESTTSWLSEYPQRARISLKPKEITWVSESPNVASVSSRGVVHALRPGPFAIAAEARRHTGGLNWEVGWPLDSIAFRFAVPVVTVGDTVELLSERYYASGNIEPDFRPVDHIVVTDRFGRKVSSPAIVHLPGPEFASWDQSERRLFEAREPGESGVTTVLHGRTVQAMIRVEPRVGRAPRSFLFAPHVPAGQPAPPSLGCFALTVRRPVLDPERRNGPYATIPVEPMDSEAVHRLSALVSRAVRLDSAAIIPGDPATGRRISSASGAVLDVERYWRAGPGDSVSIMFGTHERPSRRFDVAITAIVRRDGLVGSFTRDGWLFVVRGRRQVCGR